MSRLEVLSPRGAAEEVCFDWVAEGEGFGRLSAEQHHVGVVRRRGGSGWCFRFAVQTALGEDGFYGADDGGGDGEEQVAGIVLVFVSLDVGADDWFMFVFSDAHYSDDSIRSE